jgi:hypothetical protein
MSAGSSATPVTDYTSLDYASVVLDLQSYAQKLYPEDMWTDFNSSNFATFLLEQMGYATDLLAYNLNASVLETIVTSVVREQNFRNLAKTLDFQMKGATASSSDELRVTGISSNFRDYPLTISEHLQFTAGDGVVFQPVSTFSVGWPPPGVDPVYYVGFPVTQGKEETDALGLSSGRPSQRYPLGELKLIDGTLSVSVASVPYTLVTSAATYGPNDKIFRVETDESLRSYIIFGDGINGLIPPIGQSISASYKTGGGSETNFPVGTTLAMSNGVWVPPALSTGSEVFEFKSPATGGGPRQSLANAKLALPQSLKANNRAVTNEDYAAMALEVSGVFKAKAVAGTAVSGATPVLLFIVPSDLGAPSYVLGSSIITALKPKRMSGKRVIIKDPTYVDLVVQVDEFVANRVSRLVAKQRLLSLLLSLFSPESVDFGSVFSLQDLYKTTGPEQVEGINRVFYRKFTVSPHAGRYINRSTTGDGSVVGIGVNWDTVKRREWNIQVVAPDPINQIFCPRFAVRQRFLGEISGVSSNVVTDERASYVDDELAGFMFHPRPDELDDSFRWAITSNTESTITLSGSNLLLSAQIFDSYVVEKDEASYGKILKTTVTSSLAGGSILDVVSSASFKPLDKIRVHDPVNLVEHRLVVSSIVSPTRLRLSTTATIANTSTVWAEWESADGSVRFSLEEGATSFAVGDQLYVDTYPSSGDVVLRDQDFPMLTQSNIMINSVGGV